MIEIGAALASLKAAMDLAKVGVEARDDAKIKSAISDMASRLGDAAMAALAAAEQARGLSARLAEVEAEARELQRREAERENYVLHEIAPGNFAYRFQPVAQVAEGRTVPPHYLCQLCFDDGKKSVLRAGENYGSRVWTCAVDGAHSITGGPV